MLDKLLREETSREGNENSTRYERAQGGLLPRTTFGNSYRFLTARFDVTGAIVCAVGAWAVWVGVLDRQFTLWQAVLLGILCAAWVVSLVGARALNNRIHKSLFDDLPLILNRVLLVSVVIALAVTLVSLDPDRASLVLVATALSVVILPLARGLAYALSRCCANDATRRRVLIVGAGSIGAWVDRLLTRNHHCEIEVVGFLDKNPLSRPRQGEDTRVLGSSYDLGRVLQEYEVDQVVIAFSTAPHQRVLEMVWECDQRGVDVCIVPRFFEATTVQSSIENVRGLPLMHLNQVRLSGANAFLKRAFDVVATVAGLLVIWPVLLSVALAVKLDSPGPVIFSQRRAGYDGKHFTMHKFRSMKVGSQTLSNYTTFGDARRTRIGKYLRMSSLDELPQLINVLKGDMSLVGPRPEVWDRSQELAQKVYRYDHRYRVKSGITGWAQINGLRGDTSIEERVLYDNYYIENWSLWLDVKIIILTLFRALFSQPERAGASSNGSLQGGDGG